MHKADMSCHTTLAVFVVSFAVLNILETLYDVIYYQKSKENSQKTVHNSFYSNPDKVKLIGKFLSYVTNMIVTIVNVIIFLNIPTNEN